MDHNEWLLRRATQTEILVANTKTAEEVWIPRSFLTAVSPAEAPVRFVALIKQLEFKDGIVVPCRRGVVEMPRAANDVARPRIRPVHSGRRAPVVAIRVEPVVESRALRLLRGSLAVGILACLALMFVVRDAHLGPRLGWTSPSRPPQFDNGDDYSAVVGKLGSPTSDRWLHFANGDGYRRLWYARKGFAVILTGHGPRSAKYAGTVSRDGEILHSAGASRLNELSLTPALR